jgi:hypothetical protein
MSNLKCGMYSFGRSGRLGGTWCELADKHDGPCQFAEPAPPAERPSEPCKCRAQDKCLDEYLEAGVYCQRKADRPDTTPLEPVNLFGTEGWYQDEIARLRGDVAALRAELETAKQALTAIGQKRCGDFWLNEPQHDEIAKQALSDAPSRLVEQLHEMLATTLARAEAAEAALAPFAALAQEDGIDLQDMSADPEKWRPAILAAAGAKTAQPTAEHSWLTAQLESITAVFRRR